jgi:hypothetical protein
MIGRRATIGLSLLSALLLSAFAAQSALALEPPTSKNTTAFTCVPDPNNTGDFKDEHCDETGVKGKEKFKHELIPLKTTTEVDVSTEKVTESTKKSEPAVLRGVIAGVKVEIECTVVKNNTKESLIHNEEPEAKAHTFTGTVVTEYSKCNVKLLAKCIVAEPIIATATVHGVEGMEGPTGKEKEPNAMGLEFVGHGEKETFAEIEFKNKGEEKCAVHGKKFAVTGRVIATNGPTTESDQSNRESGATLVFTPKFKMQTLKLGVEPAEFTSIVTSKMAGAGGSPIALTTTTPVE